MRGCVAADGHNCRFWWWYCGCRAAVLFHWYSIAAVFSDFVLAGALVALCGNVAAVVWLYCFGGCTEVFGMLQQFCCSGGVVVTGQHFRGGFVAYLYNCFVFVMQLFLVVGVVAAVLFWF